MITNDLFNRVLIKPAEKGCNKLRIISGYATPAMAFHHLNTLKNIGAKVNVELIVGMTSQDGLSKSNHRGFQQLVNEDFKNSFYCSYFVKTPPVHSKVYVWFKNDMPLFAFTGSANYTQTAFSNQQELMVECSAENLSEYYKSLISDTIYCNHIDAENFVTIYNDQTYKRLQRQKKLLEDKEIPPDFVLQGLPQIRVSLLDNSGSLPKRSGLNWGQRPEYDRDPNQAYIRLPSTVYRSDFFPAVGVHFTVYTDDDKVLICTRAQANGKAIHTPHNNSLIGQYFRRRLGLRSGQFIRKEDLNRYGRTHLDFYKIDNETYYMDFSK
ncbi:MAG: NgoFVII family restriction endonuclease [Candidatus Bathyarchaeota archaeon]|nr:NgoFVII family restriction endonuclease [Candidatus Bathyarchaeota archaeon]